MSEISVVVLNVRDWIWHLRIFFFSKQKTKNKKQGAPVVHLKSARMGLRYTASPFR